MSHLVVKNFCIPCAHAPAVSPGPLSIPLCPKAAAEEVSRLEDEQLNYLLHLHVENLAF